MTSLNAILQGLNRKVGDVFYPAPLYKEHGASWNGTPVIFARTHPNVELFAEDPAKALAAVGGRIVGAVKNSMYDETADPVLKADLDLQDDAEVMALYRDHKLQLSTALVGVVNSKTRYLESFLANHVLLFPMGSAVQKDSMASITNCLPSVVSLTSIGEWDMVGEKWVGASVEFGIKNARTGMTVGEFDMTRQVWKEN